MSEVDVKFNPKFRDFFSDRSFYKVLYGSAGSGKSYSIAQKIIKRVLEERGHTVWAFRKVSTYLEASVYTTLKDVIFSFGAEGEFSFNETRKLIRCNNGNKIYCAGLDEPEKIKSITEMTIAWVEEATEFNEEDVNQIDLRMRGKTDVYRELILSFNPISELHWIKSKYFDNVVEGISDNLFVLHSDYRDNLFLDDAYVQRLLKMHSHNPNDYRVYVLGDWGRIVTGSEYYKNFNEEKHIGNTEIHSALPLHLTFDFNVIPYMSATVWQIEKVGDLWQVRGLDELTMRHPKNSTEDTCYEFLERFDDHPQGVVVYGDATGRARKTSSKKTDYMIIEQILGHRIIEMRVPRSNPLPQERNTFMNRMLWGTFPVEMIINPNMKHTIQDFTHVLEDAERKKIKETARDPITKRTYEKYGHLSDGVDYLFCEVFSDFL